MDLQSPRFGCSGPSGQPIPATRRPSNFVTYQVTPWGIGYKTNPPELTKKVSPNKSPDFSDIAIFSWLGGAACPPPGEIKKPFSQGGIGGRYFLGGAPRRWGCAKN